MRRRERERVIEVERKGERVIEVERKGEREREKEREIDVSDAIYIHV